MKGPHESAVLCVYAICLIQILFDCSTMNGLVVRLDAQAGGANLTDMQITAPVRLPLCFDVFCRNWVS